MLQYVEILQKLENVIRLNGTPNLFVLTSKHFPIHKHMLKDLHLSMFFCLRSQNFPFDHDILFYCAQKRFRLILCTAIDRTMPYENIKRVSMPIVNREFYRVP